MEALSKPWNVPRKLNQQTFERDADGQLIKEHTIPFEYHDGYLSVYYQSNNYQVRLGTYASAWCQCHVGVRKAIRKHPQHVPG